MKLKDLKTNAKNPRILKDARFKKLLNKVLCYPNLLSKNKLTYDSSDANTVLGGNQRLATLNYIIKSISTKQLEDSVKAAQKALGLENELLLNNSIAIFTEIKETKSIPSEWVQDVQGLSEDEKQAFILIDNLNDGEWDLDEIANKWDIDAEEWGLISWANSEDEQSDNSKGLEAHEDDYEQPEDDKIKTDIVIGDLFEFNGKDGQYHRLLCGDSTDKETVELLMNGDKADMIWTDPPYGINEQGDRTKRVGAVAGHNHPNFKDDSIEYAVSAFNQKINSKIKIQVWFGSNYYCHNLPETANWLVWDKRVEENQRDYNSDCELAWVKSEFNSIRIFRHLWKGFLKDSERGKKRVHATQKPIKLVEFCVKEYAPEAKLILDYFLGSGVAMVASHQLKRNCYGLELEPKYCQVIIDRMLKLDESITIKKNGVDYVNEH
jgi:DNA modification methylase